MKLYFIRHGETDWNVERKAQGQVDIPLNDYGKYLAEKTCEGFKNIKIDLCVSSPLSRALETAKIVLKGHNTPIITDDRLLELAFGDYEGIVVSGPNKSDDTEEFMRFFNDPLNFKPKGDGETVVDLVNRTSSFIEDLKSRTDYQDKSILISTHGGTLRALLGILSGIKSPTDMITSEVCPNCGVNIVEINESGKATFIERDKVYYEDEIRMWKAGE